MYANVHGVVGALIAATTYSLTGDSSLGLALGLALAFGSHFILDMLGEYGYSLKKILFTELYSLLLFFLCIYKSDLFWVFSFGFVAGNGMDLLDKKFYLAMLMPDKFENTWMFHREDQVRYAFNNTQTMIAMFICNIVMILIGFNVIKF